ncbi:MAG: uroporphyrinogen-III synthase [Oleiphilaceae bacterium]|nr:uroporphyrinogen-III synthase [Oleiphilaceae bacterium]
MAIRRPDLPLSGRRILVCRPEPEAQRLAQYLEGAGADVRVLPLLERIDIPENLAQRTLIQDLDLFRHVVAVSPHAARLLLARIDAWWPQFPTDLYWYGVGAGTAAVFEAAGLSPQVPREGFSSEHLLALPTLKSPSGERVLLAQGERGRELIHDTLKERGAAVSRLILYRRQPPALAAADVESQLVTFNPDAVVALSGETLNNLIALGENNDHNLKQRLLVVPVERVAQEARRCGFHNLCLPANLTDDAIAAGIASHLGRRDRKPSI